MIRLFGYWRSTAAYRVRIALNLKQVSYTQESVDLVKDGGAQNTPEFLAINPQGLVPALVVDGQSISQSMAILEYLEEKYPQPALLPKDLNSRAQVRQLCQLVCSDVHPLNNLRVLNYLKQDLKIDDEAKLGWYHHWLRKGFTAFEAILKKQEIKGPYTFGEELSLADACLIPQIYNANRFKFSMDDFPRLTEINANCLKLERFQNAVPENQPDAI